MRESIKTFTYTAQRSTYVASVGILGFIMLIEGGAIILFTVLLVSNLLLKLLLVGAIASVYLYLIFGLLLAPLWTKHHLTSAHLRLHYGFRLNIAIPRAAIVAAQPVHERLTLFQTIWDRYEEKGCRIVASFSTQGQVLLRLNQPISLKIGRTARPTETLLITVDQRDEFLAALNLPMLATISQTTTTASTAQVDRVLPTEKITPRVSTKLHVDRGTPAICIEHLTRRFDTFVAVNNLSMTIQPGEIYGFLGSNGAGKTTTIKMLVGLLQPDNGQVWIAGHDIWAEPIAAKTNLGYVADRSILYARLTGHEFLSFLGQLRGLAQADVEKRITYLLDLLDLTEHANRLCGAYSFGMKRKLALAGALLHQPQVLILDEPLNGLDPRSARRLKDLFIELAATGTTILLSTHDLATAESLCHRVGIIHKGQLLTEGSASELRQLAAAPDLEAFFLNLTSDQAEEVSV